MKNKISLMALFVLLLTLVSCSDSSSSSNDTDDSGISENIEDDTTDTTTENIICTFMVASDMRGYAGDRYAFNKYEYFRGACVEAKIYNPDFVILAGDQDPPELAKWTIDQFIGVPTVFVIGNHDIEQQEDLIASAEYNSNLNITGSSNYRRLTDTTFSFDYGNSHFLMVDQYEDSSSSNPKPTMSSRLIDWIGHDLKNTDKKYKFVFGHVPYVSAPDIDTGVYRSYSLLDIIPNKARQFWDTLSYYNVTAYVCGHSHMYSHNKYGNVWQINEGVALVNTVTDTEDNYGAFVIVEVTDKRVILRAWRAFTNKYDLEYTIDLTQ
jgi:predicted phosphodiesterase